MKKILITGEKSKLGVAFGQYIDKHHSSENYRITYISVRNDTWRGLKFSDYDVVLHCAGIFNAPSQDYKYYDEINVQLTEKLFKKAIDEKVQHFIYLSTMDIYNTNNDGCISYKTEPSPISLYGRSKLEAENRIRNLADGSNILLSIIRCCPVIGSDAETQMEGYMKAFKFPIFPLMFTDNKRSILHVDTLCELIRLVIEEKESGIFYPQNLPPLSVPDILRVIKKATNKKTILIPFPRFMWINAPITNRIYGSSYYDPKLSEHFENKYSEMSSEEAIQSLFI